MKTLPIELQLVVKGLPKAILALEEKSRTKRGLTLQESLTLEELRFMVASGFADPDNISYTALARSNNEHLINEMKRTFGKLSKEELLHELAIAKLRIQDLEEYSDIEESRFQFLLKYFDSRVKKRTTNRNNRTKKRKAGKASTHTEKFEQAKIIYEVMLQEFNNIDASHSREFYKRLDQVCLKLGLGSVEANTRRNYFKKLTGLKSLK